MYPNHWDQVWDWMGLRFLEIFKGQVSILIYLSQIYSLSSVTLIKKLNNIIGIAARGTLIQRNGAMFYEISFLGCGKQNIFFKLNYFLVLKEIQHHLPIILVVILYLQLLILLLITWRNVIFFKIFNKFGIILYIYIYIIQMFKLHPTNSERGQSFF